MKVKNIDHLTKQELAQQIDQGGRFVMYQYTVSIIIMTFRQPTSIHFVAPGEKAVVKGLGYTLLTLLLGWWGIPWGPIYTIGSLVHNLGGGVDVTKETLQALVQAETSQQEVAPQQLTDDDARIKTNL